MVLSTWPVFRVCFSIQGYSNKLDDCTSDSLLKSLRHCGNFLSFNRERMVPVPVWDQVAAPGKVMALVMVPELEMHPRTVPVSVPEIVRLNP